MIGELPLDLLALVASFLPRPESLLRAFCNASRLGRDPHALALWLLQRHDRSGALLALTKSPCAKTWPVHLTREAISHALEAGAQLPPAGLALAVLHWAAVTLGDGATLELLLSQAARLSPAGAGRVGPSSPACNTASHACGPSSSSSACNAQSSSSSPSACGAPSSCSSACEPRNCLSAAWPSCCLTDPKILGGQLLTDTCAAGHAGAARALLAAGAVPAREGAALKAASERGHAPVVAVLLASGLVDARADNDCALRMAARGGHGAVLALLLEAGCDARTKQDEALALAVGGGHLGVVRTLLRAGADPAARSGLLQLAANVAAPASASLLSGAGVGMGALVGDAAIAGVVDAGEGLAVEMVGALVAAGAGDGDGLALCAAAASGRGGVVAQLLQGCRYKGQARQPGQVEGTATTADHGRQEADGRVGAEGGGPLSASLECALTNGRMHVARLLLEAGATLDLSLLSGLRRRLADQGAVLQLLDSFPGSVRCGPDMDEELTQAVTDADDTFTRLLLRWGADPTGRECQALRKAVILGRLDSVRAIISAAGVAALRRQLPCCVVRSAVTRGHLEVVSELLSAGLWPGAEGSHHCCSEPRTCAARVLCGASSLAMGALLLRFGAATHAGDALRLVACGRAPSWRNEEVVQMVMEAMMGVAMEEGRRQASGAALPGACLGASAHVTIDMTGPSAEHQAQLMGAVEQAQAECCQHPADQGAEQTAGGKGVAVEGRAGVAPGKQQQQQEGAHRDMHQLAAVLQRL